MRSRARLAVVVVGLTAALACVPATASGSWLVRGAGFGHGVGMSAYGAYGYGKHGAGYREIIDHYFRHLRIKRTDSASRVRVLLDSTSGSARFSGADRACGRRLKPGRTYVAARAGSSVSLLSADGSTLERCGSHLRASGRRPLEAGGLGAYRGALDFLARDGSLLVVNAVAVDDYARGSVPAEVPAEWPRETLKAFAVACRSIALSTDVGGRAFDVYPDTRTQVYKGTRAEASRTDRAVARDPRRGRDLPRRGRADDLLLRLGRAHRVAFPRRAPGPVSGERQGPLRRPLPPASMEAAVQRRGARLAAGLLRRRARAPDRGHQARRLAANRDGDPGRQRRQIADRRRLARRRPRPLRPLGLLPPHGLTGAARSSRPGGPTSTSAPRGACSAGWMTHSPVGASTGADAGKAARSALAISRARAA